jgi:hypothetical protein
MTSKVRFAVAFLFRRLRCSEASAQGAQGQSVAALPEERFGQANTAADEVLRASPSATAERNSRGTSAYRDCARREGSRP